MFSALKKLTHRSPDVGNNTSPSAVGVNTMNVALQKKFARGVNYNLKLILKGDRNTGKSSLHRRLQGGDFSEEYIPTDEIQVASIQWNYKATDDIVKVEVWDIVDKGKKRKKLDGLKLGSGGSHFEAVEDALEPVLDAEFVDVYKGTHGVVFIFDVTKMWTFEYIDRELPKVPAHIPVLILANFIDRGHHRVVTREQALGFIEHFDRGEAHGGKVPGEIRYAESSMRNGFGLKFLHKFLNLPYLILQRESLLLQLDTNQREIHATQEELDAYQESEDGQYENFLNGLTQRRRNLAESLAPPPTVDVVAGQPSNTFKDLSTQKVKQTIEAKVNEVNNHDTFKPANISPRQNTVSAAAPKITPEKNSSSSSPNDSTKIVPNASLTSLTTKSGKLDVDNFIPDQNAIDNFLDDDFGSPNKNSFSGGYLATDDSDDETNVNPMVAGFADDLDLDDFKTTVAIVGSSSDDENAATLNEKTKIVSHAVEPKKVKLKAAKNLFQVPDSLPVLSSPQIELSAESDEEPKKLKKKKKAKKRSSKSPSRERDDLEDFLNGSPESSQPRDATVYEAL